MIKDKLIINKKKFNSRLIVGTGKYKSMSRMCAGYKIIWCRNSYSCCKKS